MTDPHARELAEYWQNLCQWRRSLAPPQQTTANEEPCRCHKALVRNTVAMFSRLRVGGPASRNSGKIRDGQDGGRNLIRGLHFAGQSRIWRPWVMIGGSDRGRYMTNDPTDWHQTLARVSGQLVHGSNG